MAIKINKKIIFSSIIILVLVAGGFFWWQKDKIESFFERKELKKMIALSEDYIITEGPDGKFIIDKKDGFKVKVPIQWEAEIGMDMFGLMDEQYVTLYSKDFSYRPPKGCSVEIQISRLQKRRVEEYNNGDFVMFPYEGAEEVKEMINFYKKNNPEEKIVTLGEKTGISLINQKEAVQEMKTLEGDIGKSVSLKVPTENRVYLFNCIIFSEECNKELKQIFETVSID